VATCGGTRPASKIERTSIFEPNSGINKVTLLAIRNEGDGERRVKEFRSSNFGITERERIYVCEEDVEMRVLLICDVLHDIDHGS
jgi:hypothetical protein